MFCEKYRERKRASDAKKYDGIYVPDRKQLASSTLFSHLRMKEKKKKKNEKKKEMKTKGKEKKKKN